MEPFRVTKSIIEQATLNWCRELKNSILSGQELLSRENRVKDADGFIRRAAPCLPAARGWLDRLDQKDFH